MTVRMLLCVCSMSLLAVHTNALLATPRAGKAAVHATASRGQPRNAQVQATAAVPKPRAERATSWPLGRIAFSLLPLAGSARRKTLETEVVKGSVWTHDQIQGVVNVNVPVRQTVIKLKDGGLWVHNPVAPTPESVRMLRELEERHGPVKHVVLGTLGLEHKALAGPFCKQFTQATVWLQPGQWSFPLPISPPLLGFPSGRRLRLLPTSNADADSIPEWADEIEFEVLGPLRFKAVGAFGETAFFHKKSKTLVVTDTIVKVEPSPPSILLEDPRALMFHARDEIGEEVSPTAEVLRKGWRRICLFGLIFYPSGIDVRLGSVFSDRQRLPPSMSTLGDGAVPFSLYPWTWARDERPSFDAIAGAPFVAPILQTLILNRFPDETLDWVERVCKWQFTRIIPSHLANDIRATPADFASAFEFLTTDNRESSAAALEQGHDGAPEQATQAVAAPASVLSATKAVAGTAVEQSPFKRLQAALIAALPPQLVPIAPQRARAAVRRAPAPLPQDLALLNAASDACTRLGLVGKPKVAARTADGAQHQR